MNNNQIECSSCGEACEESELESCMGCGEDFCDSCLYGWLLFRMWVKKKLTFAKSI